MIRHLVIKDGGIIKEGYNEDDGSLPKGKDRGKTAGLPSWRPRERDKTGIKNLRIKYNKVFGYYLEVTNSYKDMVPDYYMRKQTLTNAERYITPELKELEDMILGAEDKLIFHGIRPVLPMCVTTIVHRSPADSEDSPGRGSDRRIHLPGLRGGEK